ncbi:MAG: chemotaxis protein CheW [Thermodesulfobacteriota bacterium]
MTVQIITEPTKFVTFKLDEETFALDINQVREVLDYTTVTRVPQTPRFVRGVINLRGSVVPVVDLKLKFGLGETGKTADTRILIVEINLDNEETVLGALADSVKEVIDLEPDQIGPAPRIGARLRTEFIRGMGRRDDDFLIILDLDRVFSIEEMAALPAPETMESVADGT